MLLSASNFAALGATTLVNSGTSDMQGQVGVSPGTSIRGFPPGRLTGELHSNDTASKQAQTDAHAGYATLFDMTANTTLTGQNLGSMILTAGVYRFASSATLTGRLTFDALNDTSAVFVIQIGTVFTTAATSEMMLVNGAQSCNIFFQVGTSATLGASSSLSGTIVAHTSISAGANAVVHGSLLALGAAVSTDTNIIQPPGACI
uniref:Ice-binding protein 7 n=1 Tax=Chloromonas brevispina TaxID=201318 RepID=A0A060KV91_9CHLO|nr:ice-binding protein 7 [Chloromonas brevispina]